MKALVFILPLVFASTVLGEPPFPEFSGYFSVGKQHLFILTNLQTHESSGWITVGGSFQGFTVEDFDAEEDVLILRSGAQRSRVPLKASRVVVSKAKPNPRTTSSEVEGGSELRMTMTRDEVLSLNGHRFPGETLDALFSVMARERDGLLLFIEKRYPKEEEDSSGEVDILKSLMARMRAAGLKRGAINMTHKRDEAQTK